MIKDDVSVANVGRGAIVILLLHSVVDEKFAGVEIQVITHAARDLQWLMYTLISANAVCTFHSQAVFRSNLAIASATSNRVRSYLRP